MGEEIGEGGFGTVYEGISKFIREQVESSLYSPNVYRPYRSVLRSGVGNVGPGVPVSCRV